MQLWLMALNSRPAVAAVASLGGRGEAFAAAVLELSAFLVGGLVVGRFAGNARLPGGILLVVVALSIPILVGRATGASSVWPTPWWVVLASGGVTAGAALAARLPGRAGPRAPRPT
jgi:hypothetical protein